MSLSVVPESAPPASAIVVRPAAEPEAAAAGGDAPGFALAPFALQGHGAAATAVAFLRDAPFLLTASADRRALLWDLSDEALPAVLALRGARAALTAVALHDARVAASLAAADGDVAVHDLVDGARVARIRAHAARTPVNDLAARGPHGLLSAGNDRHVRLWDLRAKRVPAAVFVHDGPVLALAALGEHRFVAAGLDGALRVHDVRAPAAAAEVLARHDGHVSGVAVSADGALVASLGADGGRISDARPYVGKRGRDVAAFHGARVAFEPNLIRPAWAADKCVAAGGADGVVTVWDARDGTALASHEARAGAVNAVAFHPTLPVLASAAEDGSVHIGPAGVVPADL